VKILEKRPGYLKIVYGDYYKRALFTLIFLLVLLLIFYYLHWEGLFLVLLIFITGIIFAFFQMQVTWEFFTQWTAESR
jgi:hypothetical protein